MPIDRPLSVLITGANRGIGAAIAEQYRSAGAEVIGTARNPDAPDLYPLDVTETDSVAALAAQLADRPIDILICNAGVYPDQGRSLRELPDPALWALGFATNVTGVFLTVHALLPNLRRGKDARIAIISSQMGSSTRASGGSYIYRASKAAAVNLGRNLARDLVSEQIVLGVYHPGWVQTDMGGSGADIAPAASAHGLVTRIAALTPETTGCFETWDGRLHPF
ncbi:MAG: SDR family oxidoreductase [Rhodobacterales bacterium]|nr:SDR family oxidoreductase [Rhodobacterales bacterium]